jgi:hypothetical protein
MILFSYCFLFSNEMEKADFALKFIDIFYLLIEGILLIPKGLPKNLL